MVLYNLTSKNEYKLPGIFIGGNMPWDMSPLFNIKFSVEVILWGSSFSKPLSFSPCETVAQDLRVSKGQRDTKEDRNKRKG